MLGFGKANERAGAIAAGAMLLGLGCASGQRLELAGSTGAGGDTGSAASGLGAVGAGGSSGSGLPEGTYVYLHDASMLYTLDPKNPQNAPKLVGQFDCIDGQGSETSMTDFAVNAKGQMWAISSKVAHRLTVGPGATVHCATSLPLTSAQSIAFYALTFAPIGVLDPNKEVLIAGNTAGELWAIADDGKLTQHGNFGTVPAGDGLGHAFKYPGTAWQLSGDIVFLANNGEPLGFATVRDCGTGSNGKSSCNNTDTLIQIDMKKLKAATTESVTLAIRGMVVKAASCNQGSSWGYGSMFGIAAWNDKIFGFSHRGDIVSISNEDGSACLLQSTYHSQWDGAGVTTVAPVDVPTPK